MRSALVVLTLALATSVFAQEERIVFETDSLYHHIIVSETPEVRILRFHKGSAQEALGSDFAQSAISLADPYSLHMNYSKYAMVGAALVEKPKRALFVGLGAGTLPKFFATKFPECQVDVAELDPKVVEVAREYFFLGEMPNLNVTVMDGRQFVRKSEGRYDLVFLDAYRDKMIPFHLLTKEFLEELKTKLSPGGVVVSNIAIETDAQLYPWVLRTYQNAFGTVLEVNVPKTINRVLIGFAGKAAVTLDAVKARAGVLASSATLGYDLVACAGLYRDVSSKQPSKNILTDDYAPVNLMRIRKADEKDWQY
jgi:spermidine synthase